ncbi:MAG: lipid-A-disaccharide synthase N-terminal domain-containing protein [Marinibacterium sp.]
MVDQLLAFFKVTTLAELIWVAVGLAGQVMFTMRFLLQWIASERVKRSVVPEAFWWFSMAGGLILLAYAIHRRDPVFILGQSTGIFIYARNLWLLRAEKRIT